MAQDSQVRDKWIVARNEAALHYEEAQLRKPRNWTLEILLIAYLGASLLHFVHNAEMLQAYPNLPAWITRSSIYLTWLGITAVGLIGYGLYRLEVRAIGLTVLCLYAAAGLDGLLHYMLAPMDAHSHGMNFTIWFEVSVAGALLLYILATTKKRLALNRTTL